MSERACPGGSMARSERWTVRSWLVNVPVFSAHMAAGSTTSASRPVSVRKASLTPTKSRSWDGIDRIRCSSGNDTAGFVAVIQRNRIAPSSADRKMPRADQPGRRANVIGRHATDLRHPVGAVVGHRPRQLVEADGVFVHEALVHV